jgi:hypothetical protein
MYVITRTHLIYFIAGILSLFLSLHAGLYYDLVNPDAICYLKSAEAMSQGLRVGMHLCPQAQWPFYSVIIFFTAKITHLNITDSAYLINAVFSLLSVLTFIAVIKNLNNNPRLVGWAALVILLAHEFNALRQDVIRDHGFIAFYLISILCLIKYFRVHQWRFALGWSLSLIIATLFRIEAAVFLLLLPMLVGFEPSLNFSARLKAFLQLHLLTVIVIGMLITWLIIHPSQNLSRLNELFYQFSHGLQTIMQNFQVRTENLTKYVLVSDSVRDMHLVFLLTLLSWYLIEVIKVLTPLYFFILLYAWHRGALKAEKSSGRVLWGYVIINVLVTLAFLAEHIFLSKRYLMALSLVLMFWIPFALDQLMMQWKNKRWLVALLFVLMILSSLGGIVRFGYSKAYIRQAGQWLSINVPKNATLYSNDYQLMYYSNHFGDDIFKKISEYSHLDVAHQWGQFDYLAIRDDKGKLPLKAAIVFSNKRGDHIAIYKVTH